MTHPFIRDCRRYVDPLTYNGNYAPTCLIGQLSERLVRQARAAGFPADGTDPVEVVSRHYNLDPRVVGAIYREAAVSRYRNDREAAIEMAQRTLWRFRLWSAAERIARMTLGRLARLVVGAYEVLRITPEGIEEGRRPLWEDGPALSRMGEPFWLARDSQQAPLQAPDAWDVIGRPGVLVREETGVSIDPLTWEALYDGGRSFSEPGEVDPVYDLEVIAMNEALSCP